MTSSTTSGRRVLAAMSGGVDSSVMAYLLLRDGHTVTGATMRLCDTSGTETDIADARAVCDRLGLPHEIFDFRALFERRVIDDFTQEYIAGRTPNPCIVCNKHLKFGALLDEALAAGYTHIATGHYARVETDGAGRPLLKKAADESKDQSYVLWQLTPAQLSHVLLPLGGRQKTEIRALAEELSLVTAHKSDSQDICFVPDGDYAAFLTSHTGYVPVPGDFVDETGRVLGQHKGIIHYTIGQRKGLGISLGTPMFVRAKDAATGQVVLSSDDRLYVQTVEVDHLNLIATDILDAPIRCEAKLRYRHKAAPATLTQTGEHTARLQFDQPQRAPAAGQSAVFYDGDTVLGGGLIL